MRYWLIPIVLIVLSSFAADTDPAYQKVTAKDGDGVYSILRRYQLLESTVNIQKFYELNSLDVEASLIRGVEYKLPVIIYDYDGVSIRTTLGIDDLTMARRIEAYNDAITNLGIVPRSYRESLKLWVPMHTLQVDYNDAPPTSSSNSPSNNTATPPVTPVASPTTVNVPLFGSDYASVEISSQVLKGQIFYIISGHGGPDPGAMSQAQGSAICEDEYAYDVSLRLARKLMEHGAQVEVIVQDPNDGIRDASLLLCDKTELSMGRTRIPLNQLARLDQRCNEVNKLYHQNKKTGAKKQTVVCIHVDSRSPQWRQDVFFYYYEESKTGKALAFDLQRTFKKKYEKYRPTRDYRGTVSSRNLYVLRNTDAPAVYVELANIKNAYDRRRIMPHSNRQALANWLFEGLTK